VRLSLLTGPLVPCIGPGLDWDEITGLSFYIMAISKASEGGVERNPHLPGRLLFRLPFVKSVGVSPRMV
jgi:hypothetical protein